MTAQRIRQLQKLQNAWSQRKLALSAKLAQAQRQKTAILQAAREVALLMPIDGQREFKFEDFVNQRLIMLSRQLIQINADLEGLHLQHRDIAEKERQVEKVNESLKSQLEKDRAAAELAEALEYVLISDDANFRKLPTSQM